MWRESIDAGFSNFWFGIGPEAFKSNPLIPVWGQYTNPHNGFIQVFLEFGAIGLLLLSIPLLRAVLFIFDGRNRRSMEKVLLMSFSFSWLVYCLIDGVAYHFFPLVFNVVILAYMFSLEVNQ
jgi:O-antigen ligase